jgi:hypothetical protein
MASPDRFDALAASCARRLPATPSSFAQDSADSVDFSADLHALLAAVRDSDPRFAFDREGRPGALAAIRQALPVIEAELFDAVMEDVACELAAAQEALYRVALAARSKT